MNVPNDITIYQELHKKVLILEEKTKDINNENKNMMNLMSKFIEINILVDEIKKEIQKILNNLRNEKKENNIKLKLILNNIKKIPFKFKYLKTEKIELEISKILDNSILNFNKTLNDKGGFEIKEINTENKKIKDKIFLQLNKNSIKDKNYILKKAEYFKKIGTLARFSHEMGIYIFQIFLEIFKNKIGFHSLVKEKIRLYFSTWIKKLLNENCFNKIAKIEDVKNQINHLIQIYSNDNSVNKLINIYENNFFIDELFPNLCKLYLNCNLTDIIVKIVYAKEDEEFDWDNMIENLITMVDEKKVLFTYLPGLNVNEQFLDNSQIYVVAYPIDNPNKFNNKNPVFPDIESNIHIDLDDQIIFEYKKKKKMEDTWEVEFEVKLGIDPIWDSIKYKFILIDNQNYEIETKKVLLKEKNYGKCICQVFINNEKFKESSSITLDLTK